MTETICLTAPIYSQLISWIIYHLESLSLRLFPIHSYEYKMEKHKQISITRSPNRSSYICHDLINTDVVKFLPCANTSLYLPTNSK